MTLNHWVEGSSPSEVTMQHVLLLLFLCSSFLPLRAQVFHLEPKDFLKSIEENPRAQVLDLRDPPDYSFKHIPGAVNIQPTDAFFLEEVRNQLSASDTLFIYCRIGNTKEVSRLLLDNGYRVICNLKGGSVAWDTWLEKERRRERKARRP